jgi:hypothetical protein
MIKVGAPPEQLQREIIVPVQLRLSYNCYGRYRLSCGRPRLSRQRQFSAGKKKPPAVACGGFSEFGVLGWDT